MNFDDKKDCIIVSIMMKLERMTGCMFDLQFIWRRYVLSPDCKITEKWESKKWIFANYLKWTQDLDQRVELLETIDYHTLLADIGLQTSNILKIEGWDKKTKHVHVAWSSNATLALDHHVSSNGATTKSSCTGSKVSDNFWEGCLFVAKSRKYPH